MPFFMKLFEGFVSEDFAAYRQDKWSSNLFNKQRMQVKQKLIALISALEPTISGWSLELESETSAERPSIWNQNKVKAQWLYFYRDTKSQKVLQAILDRERTIAENVDDPAHHHRHIVLAVKVDQAGVEILAGMHHSAWIDRKNLRQKWSISHERAKIMSILANTESSFILTAGEQKSAARELDEERLARYLEELPKQEGWFSLSRYFTTSDPLVQDTAFADTAISVFEHLKPFYEFCAWAKTNDHLSLAKVVVEEKRAKRRHAKAPFEENDAVEIVGGLFAGRRGTVAGYDRAGKVKVRVGTLALPVDAGSLKLLSKP